MIHANINNFYLGCFKATQTIFINRKSRFLSVALLSFASNVAQAGAYCWNENLQQLIVSGDAIYFTTDKSCPGWCQVDQGWSADAQKRAYAMLLEAKATSKPVTFFWNELASTCSGTVPTYSKPTLININ